MDLSRGHFYKTIEEAETAIKQYIPKNIILYVWIVPDECIRRESPPLDE